MAQSRRGALSTPFADPLAPLAGEAEPFQLAPNLQRQIVAYAANAAPGTIVVETRNTYLSFVLGDADCSVAEVGATGSNADRDLPSPGATTWTYPAAESHFKSGARQPAPHKHLPVVSTEC